MVLLSRLSSQRLLSRLASSRFLATRAIASSEDWRRPLAVAVGVTVFGSVCYLQSPETSLLDSAIVDEDSEDDTITQLNWSGTHAVHVKNQNYWEPETIEELEQIVRSCHANNKAIRPLGSALSPNGIAFQAQGMVALSNLDEIVEINKDNMTVTVQAGARVSQVVDALRKHGLTLPNLASIAEQQMGGFIQVGAHGTGAKIAPVDHYVKSLTLITPANGSMTLTAEHGNLFELAKVGLGCLGVVAEITMEVIPAHDLVEHTFVLTRAQAKEQLPELLKKHKHMRYMWIPYSDAVVVVTNDPDKDLPWSAPRNRMENDENTRFAPLRNLLIELTKNAPEPFTKESLEGMGFGELRDALLATNPLDVDHVKVVNEAEAEFWRRSEGYQTKPSDELLQFDCGGQQWVWEICFPTGTYEDKNSNDIDFMEKLLAGIEERGIAAHSPIEQRWTASSSSLMSPAYGDPNGLHSWVGIIMYLPSDDETQRRQITDKFTGDYCDLMRTVGQEVNAASHWAKLEFPKSVFKAVDLQLQLSQRYPVVLFNQARDMLDPKGILSNPLMDVALGKRQT